MTHSALENRNVLFFDGVCNLCNGTIRFVVEHEKDHEIYFSPLQSALGREVVDSLPAGVDSLILVENGVVHVRSTAALRVAKHLRPPYGWLYYLRFIPKKIRDALYDAIARSRYRLFGKKSACMVPSPSLSARFLYS